MLFQLSYIFAFENKDTVQSLYNYQDSVAREFGLSAGNASDIAFTKAGNEVGLDRDTRANWETYSHCSYRNPKLNIYIFCRKNIKNL